MRPTTVLGSRHRFAAEVGEWDHELCRVDLWAAGKWLICDDNTAFVPQFRRDVQDTATRLRSGAGSPLPFDGLSPQATHRRLMRRAGADDETEADYALRSQFRFLDWGPTTDDVSTHLFRTGDLFLITLQFPRPRHLLKHPEDTNEVFVAEVPTTELVRILDDLITVLDEGQRQGKPL